MMTYPYFEFSGTPREMGRRHGAQACERIAGFLEYLYRASGRPRETVLQAAAGFLPLFQQHCPTVLEEVRGLAEGAEIRFEEALLLQLRGEVIPHLPAEGCTTFAVAGEHTRDGGILIGQNSDVDPEMQAFFLVGRWAPADGPRLLMWTLAGQLGYHGVSEWGLAHFANSLGGGPVSGAAVGHPTGLSHYPVKRRLYEARTREEALALWRRLPVCSSGNYMMAAGDPAIFDVEGTPAGFAVLEEGGEGFLAHANHFLSAEYRTPETDVAALKDSFARQRRMTELLAEARGELTVERMKEILSDHAGYPCCICRHEEGEGAISTAAGLIAEPQAGRLHVSYGPPCQGDWTCYKL